MHGTMKLSFQTYGTKYYLHVQGDILAHVFSEVGGERERKAKFLLQV
jgi:hypothetical protein